MRRQSCQDPDDLALTEPPLPGVTGGTVDFVFCCTVLFSVSGLRGMLLLESGVREKASPSVSRLDGELSDSL